MIRVTASLISYMQTLPPSAATRANALATPGTDSFFRRWRMVVLDVLPQGLVVASDHADPEKVQRFLGLDIAVWLTVPTEELEGVWRNPSSGFERIRPLGTYLELKDGDINYALNLQRQCGDRLGQILLAEGFIRPLDLADAVAKQQGLCFYDLRDVHWGSGPTSLEPTLLNLLEPEFLQTNLVLPLGWLENTLILAMEDPTRQDLLDQVSRQLKRPVAAVVTGRRDVLRLLAEAFGDLYSERSRQELAQRWPDDSASRVLNLTQTVLLGVGMTVLIALAIKWPWPILIACNALAIAAYLAFSLTKFALVMTSMDHNLEIDVTDQDLTDLDWTTLPIYTVLVPAYREASVLPNLIDCIKRLQYPKARLDVKLLLEEDDTVAINMARSCNLPPFIDLVILPEGLPRTKPKALNYGLLHACGEYLVIYDAEDLPEADQLLKAVAAFRKAHPFVACIQSKLNFYNQSQNLLTRWFSAEYAMWFDLLLPALDKAEWPIPLGGTSNHFRVDALRVMAAWDPYNVAEDADLGVRLHKSGYRTAVLDSTTWEEANSLLGNWIRQRSRWIKGYMQTYLVHMRHPVCLWRELGTKGFWGFQMIIGGMFWAFLLNPVYWWITLFWFLTHAAWIPRLFPPWVYYTGMFNLLIGNFVFTYANMAGAMRRRAFHLVPAALASPIYWSLMSVAAWKALWQLVARPFYWEKTVHGLVAAPKITGSSLDA